MSKHDNSDMIHPVGTVLETHGGHLLYRVTGVTRNGRGGIVRYKLHCLSPDVAEREHTASPDVVRRMKVSKELAYAAEQLPQVEEVAF